MVLMNSKFDRVLVNELDGLGKIFRLLRCSLATLPEIHKKDLSFEEYSCPESFKQKHLHIEHESAARMSKYVSFIRFEQLTFRNYLANNDLFGAALDRHCCGDIITKIRVLEPMLILKLDPIVLDELLLPLGNGLIRKLKKRWVTLV